MMEHDSWDLGLQEFLKENGIPFRSLEVYRQAFTHSSYSNEQESFKDNERLEFLGDSVLGLILSDLLVDKFPEDPEGRLSKKRASLISEVMLNEKAKELGLEKWLLLGRGEELSGTRNNPRILSSVLEAFLGAMYKDQGWTLAYKFVEAVFLKELDRFEVQPDDYLDFKSRLQEMVQSEQRLTPIYRVTGESGPEHMKIFTVEVLWGGQSRAQGKGSSKKLAEQDAAQNYLHQKETI